MAMDNLPTIDGIELLDQIGSGATAKVFAARQLGTGRIVAAKITHLGDPGDPAAQEAAERAQREAYILAQADHVNVARVYDYGVVDRHGFLIQELIRGGTVADAIARRPFDVWETVEAARGILAGLDHIHEKGVESARDIKPANIMLRDGQRHRPVLIDFGLARTSNSALTGLGSQMLSPAWAAPEQFRCETPDKRTDIYGVGATLYHMITGAKPFVGTLHEVFVQMERSGPVFASHHREGVPRELDAILSCAMAKERHYRYATAGEFLAAIDTMAAELPARDHACDDATIALSGGSASTSFGAWPAYAPPWANDLAYTPPWATARGYEPPWQGAPAAGRVLR